MPPSDGVWRPFTRLHRLLWDMDATWTLPLHGVVRYRDIPQSTVNGYDYEYYDTGRVDG
jgi:hypothetical protein